MERKTCTCGVFSDRTPFPPRLVTFRAPPLISTEHGGCLGRCFLPHACKFFGVCIRRFENLA